MGMENNKMLYIICGVLFITAAFPLFQKYFPTRSFGQHIPVDNKVDACDVVVVVLTGSVHHNTRLVDIKNTYMKYLKSIFNLVYIIYQ